MSPAQLFVAVTTAMINGEDHHAVGALDDATTEELRLALVAGAGAFYGLATLCGKDTKDYLRYIALLEIHGWSR